MCFKFSENSSDFCYAFLSTFSGNPDILATLMPKLEGQAPFCN
jgi:hypothetical protein